MLPNNRRAFSLIEIMVVVAIIGILVGIRTKQYRAKKTNPDNLSSEEFKKYPELIQKHFAILSKWTPPPTRSLSKDLMKEREIVLADIKNESGFEIPNVLYSGLKGNAVVAGGLVILKSSSSGPTILANNGLWKSLPEETIQHTDVPTPNYYNTVSYAGIWKNAARERVIIILVDQVDRKEKFHFYVDGSEWTSNLERRNDISRIDFLKGEVKNPDNITFSFSGKVARYFPDSVGMPPMKLISYMNSEYVLPLLPTN